MSQIPVTDPVGFLYADACHAWFHTFTDDGCSPCHFAALGKHLNLLQLAAELVQQNQSRAFTAGNTGLATGVGKEVVWNKDLASRGYLDDSAENAIGLLRRRRHGKSGSLKGKARRDEGGGSSSSSGTLQSSGGSKSRSWAGPGKGSGVRALQDAAEVMQLCKTSSSVLLYPEGALVEAIKGCHDDSDLTVTRRSFSCSARQEREQQQVEQEQQEHEKPLPSAGSLMQTSPQRVRRSKSCRGSFEDGKRVLSAQGAGGPFANGEAAICLVASSCSASVDRTAAGPGAAEADTQAGAEAPRALSVAGGVSTLEVSSYTAEHAGQQSAAAAKGCLRAADLACQQLAAAPAAEDGPAGKVGVQGGPGGSSVRAAESRSEPKGTDSDGMERLVHSSCSKSLCIGTEDREGCGYTHHKSKAMLSSEEGRHRYGLLFVWLLLSMVLVNWLLRWEAHSPVGGFG